MKTTLLPFIIISLIINAWHTILIWVSVFLDIFLNSFKKLLLMKPIREKLLIKDATINKVQFDKEWFYKLDDMAFYLKEDLSEVEFIYLPMMIDGQQEFVKCSTYDDIIRGRKEF